MYLITDDATTMVGQAIRTSTKYRKMGIYKWLREESKNQTLISIPSIKTFRISTEDRNLHLNAIKRGSENLSFKHQRVSTIFTVGNMWQIYRLVMKF